MTRAIASIALFGMLVGGASWTAEVPAAETQDKSPSVRIQALKAQPTSLFVARGELYRATFDPDAGTIVSLVDKRR